MMAYLYKALPTFSVPTFKNIGFAMDAAVAAVDGRATGADELALWGVLLYICAAAQSAHGHACAVLVVALKWVRQRLGGGGGWMLAAGEVADGALVALGGGSPVDSTGLEAAWWAGLGVLSLYSVGMCTFGRGEESTAAMGRW